MLKIEEKNCTLRNVVLVHCTFAFKIYYPNVVLCIGTKPRNSSKISKLFKTTLIKTLR